MKSKVNFKREEWTLVGNLFTPEDFSKEKHYKAVIVQGSFTSVKEQMSETYAQKFADKGFVALAFDYSHYGESDGQPRQFESTSSKLSDLEAAVTYLHDLPYIDAVSMVGVCTSASNAAYLAASDKRVKAIATVAANLPDLAMMTAMFGEDEIARRRKAAAEASQKYKETGYSEVITAYSETDQTAANIAPAGTFDYYLNKDRGAIPQYKNETAVMSWETLLDMDAVSLAPAITIPTMVVHSDYSFAPDQAKKFYNLLAGEKELVWADGTHFDYYDSPKQIDNAVEQISRFFNEKI
ncbi:alpha/beta hydrolase [Mucilaginibacter gossypii]|uniref:AB hydrolase-1 domain-containing protein n=1 Tax=Mucilaginibacter gossypii TaxID=551996 RepID=A0A1G8CPT6_9SPHI|nr:alpha/beta hydrolase [Mucilaginibacter gossypii]SDH47495.1 hypothetical protein SAMN05192573_11010 [Mucilaginibacter gossypii]